MFKVGDKVVWKGVEGRVVSTTSSNYSNEYPILVDLGAFHINFRIDGRQISTHTDKTTWLKVLTPLDELL